MAYYACLERMGLVMVALLHSFLDRPVMQLTAIILCYHSHRMCKYYQIIQQSITIIFWGYLGKFAEIWKHVWEDLVMESMKVEN